MSKLNISQAAKQWGKSRQTIYNYLEQGKLSGDVDNEGSTHIDTSELLRVFGEPSNKTAKLPPARRPNNPKNETYELRHELEIERLKRSHSEESNTRLQNELRELKSLVNDLQLRDERRDKQLQTALERVNNVLDKVALPDTEKKKAIGFSGLWDRFIK